MWPTEGRPGGDTTTVSGPRPALTHDGVLRAAVELADQAGMASLTMRSLARHLGVEAMSLYHHVANKDALLDGMVDLVFAEMHQPRIGGDWVTEMRLRSVSGRMALTRHRWAVGLMDSRSASRPRNPPSPRRRHRGACAPAGSRCP